MNAMIWTPPARADLDDWAALGNPGWSWTDLVPALRRAEWPAADRRPRGPVGISVGPLGTVNPVTRALVAAARSEGIAANDGFFDGNMDGRTGPLSSNVAEAGAFVRIRSGADRPEVELLFAPTFFVDHGFGNPPGHGYTVACILLHPESTGSVSNSSAARSTSFMSTQPRSRLTSVNCVIRARARRAMRCW